MFSANFLSLRLILPVWLPDRANQAEAMQGRYCFIFLSQQVYIRTKPYSLTLEIRRDASSHTGSVGTWEPYFSGKAKVNRMLCSYAYSKRKSMY